MKLLFVANAFDQNHYGGVENYLREATAEFVRQGHDCVVLARQWSDGADHVNDSGVRVKYIAWPRLGKGDIPFRPFALRKRLARILETAIGAEKPDLIVTRLAEIASAVCLAKPAARHVFISPGISHQQATAYTFKGKLFNWWWTWQMKTVERFAFKNSSANILFSRNMLEQVRELHGDGIRAEIIPPGVDFLRFKPCVEKRALIRKEYGIGKDDFVALYLGRFGSEKGVLPLVESFSQVKGEHGVKLVCVGDGELRKQAEAAAGGRNDILFPGKTNTPEKWYAAADLMLLPSWYESFGQVLLETMACGCPPLAFKSSPPLVRTASGEIIDEDETGFFVPAARFDLMVEKVARLATQKKMVLDTGIRGREKVFSHNSWKEHCSAVLAATETGRQS
jgi:glycosyltransferase involved in cell wall biosynthesis